MQPSAMQYLQHHFVHPPMSPCLRGTPLYLYVVAVQLQFCISQFRSIKMEILCECTCVSTMVHHMAERTYNGVPPPSILWLISSPDSINFWEDTLCSVVDRILHVHIYLTAIKDDLTRGYTVSLFLICLQITLTCSKLPWRACS